MSVEDFARRVERLCEFLLEKVPSSEEREILFDLKEEAADLQSNPDYEPVFKGLGNYIRGIPEVKKE